MKKLSKLVAKCINRGLELVISFHQGDSNCSVKIYDGYEKIFHTDGHMNPKKAIKAGLAFMSDYKREITHSYYSTQSNRVEKT